MLQKNYILSNRWHILFFPDSILQHHSFFKAGNQFVLYLFCLQSLVKFANVHLSSLGWPVTSLERDFSDGVRLILLTGCLEVILFFQKTGGDGLEWYGIQLFLFSFSNIRDDFLLRAILFLFTCTSWNQTAPRRNWKIWTLHSGLFYQHCKIQLSSILSAFRWPKTKEINWHSLQIKVDWGGGSSTTKEPAKRDRSQWLESHPEDCVQSFYQI